MKILSRDILFTLALKIVLLIALYFVCVHGMKPVLLSSKEWMLGNQEILGLDNKKMR